MPRIRHLGAVALTALLLACSGGPEARDTVTLAGSANLLPGPDAFFRPSFAELLIEAAELDDWTAVATGNVDGVARLCGRQTTRDTLTDGVVSAPRPGAVLLTREIAALERADCARRGVELQQRQIARYTGSDQPGLEGIWLVWDRAAADEQPALAAVIATARRDSARLLEESAYGPLFAPVPAG
ncbi:MAG: hypothetical protein AAGE13_05355 [Pseudomonadota bacterium]